MPYIIIGVLVLFLVVGITALLIEISKKNNQLPFEEKYGKQRQDLIKELEKDLVEPNSLLELKELLSLRDKEGHKIAELAIDEKRSLIIIFYNNNGVYSAYPFYRYHLRACEVFVNSKEDKVNLILRIIIKILRFGLGLLPGGKLATKLVSSFIQLGTEFMPLSVKTISKLTVQISRNITGKQINQEIPLIKDRTLKNNSKEFRNYLAFARQLKYKLNKLIPEPGKNQTINYYINVNQGAGASHFQYSNQDAGRATISYDDRQFNVDQGTAGAHFVHVDKNSITAVSYTEPSQQIEQEYIPQKGYQDLHTTSSWEKFQRKQQEKDEKSQSNNPWKQGF